MDDLVLLLVTLFLFGLVASLVGVLDRHLGDSVGGDR